MAYRSGVRLEGLGQTTSWWQVAGEVVTAVAKAAPSVVSAFTKSPTAAAPMVMPAIVGAPSMPPGGVPAIPAAPAPAAAGMLGLPTWGWVALGGGALLLVVLTMGGRGAATPVYVVDRGVRRR